MDLYERKMHCSWTLLVVFLSSTIWAQDQPGAVSIPTSHLLAAANGGTAKIYRFLNHTPQYLRVPLSAKRRLQQSGRGASCSWNSAAETCEVSGNALRDLFAKSDNRFASFTAEVMDCDFYTNSFDCEDNGCYWMNDGCRRGQKFSDAVTDAGCIREASVFLQSRRNDERCGENSFITDCNDASYCSWSDATGSCVYSLLEEATGIPMNGEQPEGLNQVLENLVGRVSGDIVDNFDIASPTFDWGALLDWEVPSYDCPTDARQEVCDFAMPFVQLNPLQLYCSEKYSALQDSSSCNANEKCEVALGTCAVAASIRNEIEVKGAEVLFDNIGDSMVRSIIRESFICVRASEADCTGNCVWAGGETGCEISQAWIDNTLHRRSSKNKDPVCRYFSALVSSGCSDAPSEDSCSSLEQCEWDLTDFSCEPSDGYFRDLILEDSAKLRRRYEDLNKKCNEASDSFSCENI